MSKVLIVDDEPDIVELLVMHFQAEGHQTLSLGSGHEVVALAAKEEPDLVILDVMMPGIDGFQVQKRLKSDTRTRHIPVIMLTARTQVRDRIAGLESGADDYLTKPFSPRELILRASVILRRSKRVNTMDEMRHGPFRLDRKNLALSVDDTLVDLTVTELKLITILMENPDQVFTRAELLHQVWSYSDESHSRTLDTHVKRLRDKLGDFGAYIQTVRGIGYLFAKSVMSEESPG
jgi:two-component system, OmpR family, phosphate regulon response regulator PhoB